MKKNLIKNAVFGFGGQLIVLILGIVVPRIMITSYGSDTNGLLSTVTQIFTYMTLLEAGIGQAARNALYKPISENDIKSISKIASVSQKYFRKVSVYYFIGVILLSICLPFVVKSELDKFTIFWVILLQGLAGAITFNYIQTQTVILNVYGKGYVNNGINVFNQVMSYIARILLAILGMNVVFIQVVYFIITVAKVFFYKLYFKKKLSLISFNVESDEKLEDRNSFILTEVAWTIFSSTDMIVLSIFLSTKLSSVYAIYNMVFTSLNVLLNAVYSSVNYILGQTYFQDKNKYINLHDSFNSLFMCAITVLMSVAYILILPFISLYTDGVTDIEYIYTYLPILFCLVQLLSWSRFVSGNLTAVAGYAKRVSRVSLLEALVNLVLSVFFAQIWGITGVLLATVIALPLKVIYCTYITDKVILNRSIKKTVSILFANYILFFSIVIINNYLNLNISNYLDFCIYGVVLFFIISLIGVIINVIINPNSFEHIKNMLLKK